MEQPRLAAVLRPGRRAAKEQPRRRGDERLEWYGSDAMLMRAARAGGSGDSGQRKRDAEVREGCVARLDGNGQRGGVATTGLPLC